MPTHKVFRAYILVGQTTILLHLRCRSPRHNSHLPLTQPHVGIRNRRLSNSLCIGLLPNTNDLSRFIRYRSRYRPSDRVLLIHHFNRLVYPFGQFDLCRSVTDGSSAITGGLSGGIIIWVFCIVEYIQRRPGEEVGQYRRAYHRMYAYSSINAKEYLVQSRPFVST